MSKTKIVSKKTVMQSELFTVYETELILKNGSKKTYQSILRKPAITVLPITSEYEIYLIKQYRFSHEAYLLEAIAGFIEDGENPHDSARRELKEEGGIEAKKLIPLPTIDSAGSIALWKQYMFLAKELKVGENNLEEDEEIELVKMSLEEGVEKVLSGEITTAPTVISILTAQIMKNKGQI